MHCCSCGCGLLSISVRYITCWLLLVYLLLSISAVQAQADTISAIRFIGNNVTKERVLRQELTIKVGDPVDKASLQDSRQSIMDLGLFISVAVVVSEAGVVVFTVKEKHYVLLLPRFSQDSDTNEIKPGARLTINNVAGLNQRLKLTYIQSDPEKANHGKQDELGLEYVYPKINGSKYNLSTSFSVVRSPLQAQQSGTVVAEYEQSNIDARLFVSRWWKKKGPSSGWLMGLGVHVEEHDYRYVSGLNDAYIDDHAVSILGEISYIDVHDYLYSRTGVQYGYSVEQGLTFLGSDYKFNRHLFYYRRFLPLHEAHHNLNIQARLGFSGGDSNNLGEDVYDIGGYGDLRAYDDAVSGDAFVLLNIEYLRPVFDRKYVRGLLFVDAGNAYANSSDVDLSDLKWATGLGLRWRIKGFVKLDLSLEYAYNLEDKKDRLYFRTKGAF